MREPDGADSVSNQKRGYGNNLYFKILAVLIAVLIFGFYIVWLYKAAQDSIVFTALGITPLKVVMILAILAGAAGILAYLQPAQSNRTSTLQGHKDLLPEIDDQRERISLLEEKLDGYLSEVDDLDVSFLLDGDEKQELKKILIKKLEEENQLNLLTSIEDKVVNSLHFRNAEDVHSKTVDRLEIEIFDQARRGNVNLVLGIVTTLTGVAILSYSVFQAPPADNYVELISHFLPKLSLVILIEVFAYFFLRLYKQGLSEIKYFQNEITNIESKYLALNVSLSCGINEGLIKVVEKLLATERNFLLNKGQSTVELERVKAEQSHNVTLTENLSKLIAAVKNN